MHCQGNNAQVKIEVNTITRGHVFDIQLLQVVDQVQEEFDKFAAIKVMSFAELYGGKICAAIDRQHPRDLFDIKLLFQEEGITDKIWQAFIIGLISHYKPINELLFPGLKDQRSAFDNQFVGMTLIDFSYIDYENTRDAFILRIKERLDANYKNFLLSFETGEPDWGLFAVEKAKELPAVKWKLLNLKKLKEINPEKHRMQIENFRKHLDL